MVRLYIMICLYFFLVAISVISCASPSSSPKPASSKSNNKEQRDVGDSEANADYSSSDDNFQKIPVYIIQNGGSGAVPIQNGADESKISQQLTLLQNTYEGQTYQSPETRPKPSKYGFYAPYKTQKVTPIHEPQAEPVTTEAAYPSEDYQALADAYQRPEYASVVYKAASAAAASSSNPVPSPTVGYIKLDHTQIKAYLEKQQNLLQTNNQAHAPAYQPYTSSNTVATPSESEQSAPAAAAQQQQHLDVPMPHIKKFMRYDPENNVQIQYVIKYVPVPYAMPASEGANPQHQPVVPPENTYITPKPLFTLNDAQKSAPQQSYQNYAPVTSTESYISSNDYSAGVKYAQAYSPVQHTQQQQYAPAAATAAVQKTPYASAPLQQHYTNAKYYSDKSASAISGGAPSKKYIPTSFVLSSIGGKSNGVTHYTTQIRHETPAEEQPAQHVQGSFSANKYIGLEDSKSYSPPQQETEYSQPDPLYEQPELKYKSALEAVGLTMPLHTIFSSSYDSPFAHYQKKDVSGSVSNPVAAAAAQSNESSTPKSKSS